MSAGADIELRELGSGKHPTPASSGEEGEKEEVLQEFASPIAEVIGTRVCCLCFCVIVDCLPHHPLSLSLERTSPSIFFSPHADGHSYR
jgi:hypothetical protein